MLLIKRLRVNNQIRISPIRLIDEKGEFLGEMATDQALKLAEERSYDLIEVNPNDRPPICKLGDYGKIKYEKDKQEQKHRKSLKIQDVKTIRVGAVIGDHDLQTKARQARQFLDKGHKIKVVCFLKGRVQSKPELGEASMRKFVENIQPVALEQDITRQGRVLSLTVAPGK